MQLVFNLDVRDHFAADLAEAREAVGDGEETVFFHERNVAGGIPAILKDLGCFLRFAEIAFHHVGALNQQHARGSWSDRLSCVQIDDAHGDAGKRVANFAATPAYLAKSGCAEIAAIHGHHRRALGAAVALKRSNPEGVFEGESDALGKLFRADEHKLQTTEAFRGTAAHVGLQKCRRCDEEGDAILFDEFADDLRIERVGMVDDTDAVSGGHPKRGHEAEGVKEGQDTENLVAAIEHEDLRNLLNVGHDVEVGKHHALGVTGAAAGKDHGGESIDCGRLAAGCFKRHRRTELDAICA